MLLTQMDSPGIVVGLWNGTQYLTWVVNADGYRCYTNGVEMDPKDWDRIMPASLTTDALCQWAKKHK